MFTQEPVVIVTLISELLIHTTAGTAAVVVVGYSPQHKASTIVTATARMSVSDRLQRR